MQDGFHYLSGFLLLMMGFLLLLFKISWLGTIFLTCGLFSPFYMAYVFKLIERGHRTFSKQPPGGQTHSIH